MKKAIWILVIAAFLLFPSCGGAPPAGGGAVLSEFDFLHLDEFKNRGFTSIVPEYSSEVSVCFEDQNRKNTLMIFASPIQYVDQYQILTPIDTRISSVTDAKLKQNGYVYQTASCDISAYYPEYIDKEKGIMVGNRDGQYEFGILSDKELFSHCSEIQTWTGEKRSGVVYKDAFGKGTSMQSYPTALGTRNEITVQKKGAGQRFIFWLDAGGLEPHMEPGGYILLVSGENEKTAGIIQPPLLKDKAGHFSVNSQLKIERQAPGRYTVEALPDEAFINDKNNQYPFMFDICFEMRKEKQPDTQVFSGKPSLNQYLSNYTVIGNHPDYGESHCYIRFQFMNQYGLAPEQTESVSYVTRNMTGSGQTIDLFRVTGDWCALTSNWNQKTPFDQKITSVPAKRGVLRFDITDIAKEYVMEQTGDLQRNGLLMKSESDMHNVLISHDSTVYPVRIETTFQK